MELGLLGLPRQGAPGRACYSYRSTTTELATTECPASAFLLYSTHLLPPRSAMPATLLIAALSIALARECSSTMDTQAHIHIDPAVRGGKPCIMGTRITVYDILEYLAGGMSEDEILVDFPALRREDIRAALQFAAARERRLSASPAG